MTQLPTNRDDESTVEEHVDDHNTLHAQHNELDGHVADTSVHGIADTAALETTSGAAAKVAAHEADSTSVHGIADTAALETATGATAKVAAHEAAGNPHPGYATDGDLSGHAADTTAIHGIPDTAALETTTGSTAKVAAHEADGSAAHAASAVAFTPTGTIAATDVQAAVAEAASESVSALALKAPIASPTFTGITTAPEFSASGLTGAVAASRYVGGTATGAPTTGTFAIGDFVVDQTGKIWICTVAGTPGTWVGVHQGGATESVNVVASSGSTETIPDPTTATISRIVLDANCTFTFPTAAAGKSFTLVLVQDGTGSRTVTWPGTVKWAGGTAPTLSTGINKIDYFTFVCTDGTNWAGFTSGLDIR